MTPKIRDLLCRLTLMELSPGYYDHEVVRALETHQKAVPWNSKLTLVWSRVFQV